MESKKEKLTKDQAIELFKLAIQREGLDLRENNNIRSVYLLDSKEPFVHINASYNAHIFYIGVHLADTNFIITEEEYSNLSKLHKNRIDEINENRRKSLPGFEELKKLLLTPLI